MVSNRFERYPKVIVPKADCDDFIKLVFCEDTTNAN